MSSDFTFVDNNDQLKATVRTENGRTRVTLEDLRNERVQELSPGSAGYEQVMGLARTIQGETGRGILGNYDRPLSDVIGTMRAQLEGNTLNASYSVTNNGRVENGGRTMAGDLGNLRGGNNRGGRPGH